MRNTQEIRNFRADDLSIRLQRHRPWDGEEQAHLTRMQDLMAHAADPFPREHFSPGHFTASVFLLDSRGQALLLLHHPRLLKWLQPGGHVEPEDQTLWHTAGRELQEETSLRSKDVEWLTCDPLDLDIHPIPVHRDEPAHEHFDVRFLARVIDPAWQPRAGVPMQWVPLGDLTLSDASVRRAAARIMRREDRS